MKIINSFYSGMQKLEVEQSIIDEQILVYDKLIIEANEYALVKDSSKVLAILEHPNDGLEVSDTNWYYIANKAREHGLISQAFGGVMLLAHPNEQIEKGHYHRIQIANGGEWRCKEISPINN